jgi:hypothetical protein
MNSLDRFVVELFWNYPELLKTRLEIISCDQTNPTRQPPPAPYTDSVMC